MLKTLLYVVFAFVGVEELNAISMNVDLDMEWTEGSAVNVTVGPEDALYCRLENNMNNRHRLVYEAFGPCRITLNRVTRNDRGYWQIWYSANSVSVDNYYFFVDVLAAPVNTEPRIISSVERYGSMVILTCSVPEELEVESCTFRNPKGNIFIASPEILEDSRYKSYAKHNSCTLELLKYQVEHQGMWRCGVNTAQDTRYSFLKIKASTLDDDSSNHYYWPQLNAEHTSVLGTEGKEKTLFCSIDAAVRYCYFRSPNGTVINISPSTSSADFEYIGNGFDAGECGVRIKNVQPSDHGQWSCNVGLNNSFVEQRDIINFNVSLRATVEHRWLANLVIVNVRISPGYSPKLEYCRFVRSDGLGFHSENVAVGYIFEPFLQYGDCNLTIRQPQAVDLLPWTVIAKIEGEDEEVSVTTTIENHPTSKRGISSITAIILWSSFGTIFMFLFMVSFLPKKNREWTSQRVARIRNSLRRQPHPQSNEAGLPNHTTQTINTNIQTDLPPPYSQVRNSQPSELS